MSHRQRLHRVCDWLFEPPAMAVSWFWYRVLNGVRLK